MLLLHIFFFKEPATTVIYKYLNTLSLHDALPIYLLRHGSSPVWLSVKTIAASNNQPTDEKAKLGLPREVSTICQSSEFADATAYRSDEHTSELQSLMRISYAVFCLKNKKHNYY